MGKKMIAIFNELSTKSDEYKRAMRSELKEIIRKSVMERSELPVRIFTPVSGNFGHLSNTLFLLESFIRFCPEFQSLQYEFYYFEDGGGKNNQFPLLETMVPSLTQTEKTCIIEGASVSFIAVAKRPPERAPFALCGGFDGLLDSSSGAVRTDKLNLIRQTVNTDGLLIIQPFLWDRHPDCPSGLFIELCCKEPIFFNFNERLTDMSGLSKGYNSLALYFPPASYCFDQGSFDRFIEKASSQQKTFLHFISRIVGMNSSPSDGAIDIWPVYGLHTVDNGVNLSGMLLKILYTALVRSAKRQKDVVIFIVGDKMRDQITNRFLFALLDAAWKGTAAFDEFIEEEYEGAERQKLPAKNALKPIVEMLVSEGVGRRCARYYTEEEFNGFSPSRPGAAEVKVHLAFVGNLPRMVFHYLFYAAQYPPIFEGQATTGMAMSMGKPFIQFNKNLETNNYELDGMDTGLSSAIYVDTKALVSGSAGAVEVFVDRLMEDESRTSFFTKYPQVLVENNKFDTTMYCISYAIDFIFTTFSAKNTTSGLPFIRTGEAETLDSLFTKMEKWLEGKTEAALSECFADWRFLKILPGVSPDCIFCGSLQLTKEEEKGKIKCIVLTADSCSVGDIRFRPQLRLFCQPPVAELAAQLRLEGDMECALPGLRWVGLEKSGITITAPQENLNLLATLDGYVAKAGVQLQMSFLYPGSQLRMEGAFDVPLGMDKVIELTGGYDVSAGFPELFRALGGFGMTDICFLYDASENQVQKIELTLSTAEEWVFLQEPKLAVTPSVKITIKNPASFTERCASYEVKGQFLIGEGKLLVQGFYPDFHLVAALEEGSAIDFNSLIGRFSSQAIIGELTDFSITRLSFEVFPSRSAGSFRGAIESQWEITEGFTLSGLSITIDKNGKELAFALSGYFQLLKSRELMVAVKAAYASESGWQFAAGITNEDITISQLIQEYMGPAVCLRQNAPDMPLFKLAFRLDLNTKDWAFEAKVKDWKIEFLDMLVEQAAFAIGKKEEKMQAQLSADVVWLGMDFSVWYRYTGANDFGIRWLGTEGSVKKEKDDYTASLTFAAGMTLGKLVEELVELLSGSKQALEAPWNLLNSISLEGKALCYNFTTKEIKIGFSIPEINLGFAKLSGISIQYGNGEYGTKKGVEIAMEGSFPWAENPKSISWDASKPGAASAPDGVGNKYFALTMLSLGQHMELAELEAAKTVDEAVEALKQLPAPDDKQLPALTFSQNSSWMFAMELYLLKLKEEEKANAYMIQVQIVLHDASLYAARLRLQGEAAKFLKNLDVQVLYKKISDNLGMFQAEIVLPDVMRYLTIGAYSLTVPVFGLTIYTNGDFIVDFGFPWKRDFSRSLSIEAVIPPGIPLLGSAGIYLGKLSGESGVDYTPKTSLGVFNPVTIFGFGLQVGVGKSLHYGVLKASFSLTVFGIIEGVIAKWNSYAYQPAVTGTDLNTDYYTKVTGIVGISGKLYGCVDFAIIKAEVSVALELSVQFDVESYRATMLTVHAYLSVEASLTIDLWIIQIRIHLSFSMDVRETFRIGEDALEKAPWGQPAFLDGALAGSVLLTPSGSRYTREGDAATVSFHWQNLTAPRTRIALKGYTAATPTVCLDVSRQQVRPAAVAMLLVETAEQEKGYEALCAMALRWAVAAALPEGAVSVQEVDEKMVDKEFLDGLIDGLSGPEENALPISYREASDFMSRFACFENKTVALQKRMQEMGEKLRNAETEHTEGVFLPFPAETTITLVQTSPEGNSEERETRTLSDYTQLTAEKLKELRRLFDLLAVQVEEEENRYDMVGAETNFSMAEWVFADYLLLIVKQSLRCIRDRLRNMQQEPGAEESIVELTARIAENGGAQYHCYDIMAANASLELTPGKTLLVGDAFYNTQKGDTLQQIAADYNMSLAGLANSHNQSIGGLFAPDRKLNLVHLEQYPLGELIKNAAQAGDFGKIGSMASRYYLHGIRISTGGISSKAPLSEEAGLYELTGQQFFLKNTAGWSCSMEIASDAKWFAQEKPLVMEIPLAVYEPLLSAARDLSWMEKPELALMNQYAENPLQHTFSRRLAVKPETPVKLGGGTYESPGLWAMPVDMDKEKPYCIRTGVFDEVSSRLKTQDVSDFMWAGMVAFRAHKAPEGAEGILRQCYEISGISGTDVQLLQEAVSAGAAPALTAVGYAGQEGLFLANGDSRRAYVVRTNLSTDSNPPPQLLEDREAEGQKENKELLRMLWEAGITNSGGYYLLYGKKGEEEGLPEEIFDETGCAQMYLLYAGGETVPEAWASHILLPPLSGEGWIPFGERADKKERRPADRAGVISVGRDYHEVEEPQQIVTMDEARRFLAGRYHLLGYRIGENEGFAESPYTFPVSQTGQTGAGRHQEGAGQHYAISIPYSRFAKTPGGVYAGVGQALKLAARWQDIYGNLLSDKEQESLLQTGYEDALIGLASWPGIAAGWYMKAESQRPEIVISLTFDDTVFAGLTGEEMQKKAAGLLEKYGHIYAQLTDVSGVELVMETSLARTGILEAGTEWMEKLCAWLESGEKSIKAFLQAAAEGRTAEVQADLVLTMPLAQESLRQEALYELTMTLQIHRKMKKVLPGLSDIPDILAVSTAIPPLSTGGGEAAGASLKFFADSLESALPGRRVMTDSGTKALWILREGEGGIELAFSGRPVVFGMRPISLTLKNSTATLYRYNRESGLSQEAVEEKTFVNIDESLWLDRAVAGLEKAVSEENIGWIKCLDVLTGSSYLDALLELKKDYAGALADYVIPVLEKERGRSADTARERMYQLLLSRLTNYGRVRGIAVYTAKTGGSIPLKPGEECPLLYGYLERTEAEREAVELELAAVRIPFLPDGISEVGVVITAPTLLKDKNGKVLSSYDLSPVCHITHLEHGIHSVPEVENYKASSWLGFVTGEKRRYAMEAAQMPLPLCNYPALPVLQEQECLLPEVTGQIDREKLQRLIEWDYSFAYQMPYFYPQDSAACYIRLNEAEKNMALENDLFQALARLVELLPQMEESGRAMRISFASDEKGAMVKEGALLLDAYQKLYDGLLAALQKDGKREMSMQELPAGTEEVLYFTLLDREVEIGGQAAFVAGVKVREDYPLSRYSIPQVRIGAPRYQAVEYVPAEPQPDEKWYYYTDEKGALLSPEEGQRLTERQVVLPGLDMLSVQNARAGMHIDRNRELIAGEETAAEFIYSTGDVAFSTPCHARREVPEKVYMKEVAGTQLAGLEEYLTVFLDTLMEKAPEDLQTLIQVEGVWQNYLYDGIDPVIVPVFLQSATLAERRNLQTLAKSWVDYLQNWYQEHVGGQNGEECEDIAFRFTFYHSLSSRPAKILSFSNVEL